MYRLEPRLSRARECAGQTVPFLESRKFCVSTASNAALPIFVYRIALRDLNHVSSINSIRVARERSMSQQSPFFTVVLALRCRRGGISRCVGLKIHGCAREQPYRCRFVADFPMPSRHAPERPRPLTTYRRLSRHPEFISQSCTLYSARRYVIQSRHEH
jgi:hypothetical protein